MKRMQAIVSGKKKQCTKLPAPTSSSKEGKTKESKTEIGKNNKDTVVSPPKPYLSTKENGTSKSKKSSGSKISPNKKGTSTITSTSSAPPSSPISSLPVPLSSSSTSTTTTGTSTDKNTSSIDTSKNAIPGVIDNKDRNGNKDWTSKLPASLPKSTKSDSKGKASKESTYADGGGKGATKSKSFLVRKLSSSSKDKQRKPVEIRRSRSVSDPNRSDEGSVGYSSSGCETDSSRANTKAPAYVRPEIEDLQSHGSISNVSSSTLTPQPSLQRITNDASSAVPNKVRGNDGTLEGKDGDDVSLGSDLNSASSVTSSSGILSSTSSSLSRSHGFGSHQHPASGGYKDRRYKGDGGSTSGDSLKDTMLNRPDNGNNNGQSGHAFYDPASRGRNGTLTRDNRGVYRNGSSNSVHNPIYDTRHPYQPQSHPKPHHHYPDPTNYYPNSYKSLPRSRSITPTPDNAMLYRSLPRRSNSNTMTSQGTNHPRSGYPNNSASYGSLSRTGSESGYNTLSHMDRPRPTVGSSTSSISSHEFNQHYPYGPTSRNPPQHHYPMQPNIQSKQMSRAGSVPPQGAGNVPDSIYSMARAFSATPEDDLDRQRRAYPSVKSSHVGNVPLGYESESNYSTGNRGGDRLNVSRNYESDSGYDLSSRSQQKPGLRVQPGDEIYMAGPNKKAIPRRHTTAGGSKDKLSETERKREAFMTLLAQRYPQYADRIHGGIPASAMPNPGGTGTQPTTKGTDDVPARSRDPQRRRPNGPALTYDPRLANNTSFDYEDQGTMSDLELPSFQRGGFMRGSLPIVRSGSTSLERPLGLVFLVHGSQTKKSLLPNELTTLDTVRALFVRAFPELTMEIMEAPRKKIYVLDTTTNIYFQLEDLGEIKDRSVLKLHETDDEIPQKVRERQEIRGRTVQVPLSRTQSQNHADNPEYSKKSHTLPPGYTDPANSDQWNGRDLDRRSRSRTPEPLERQRYSHSPERFSAPERGAGGGSLNPIPENRQVNPHYREPFYETIGPHSPNNNYTRGGYPQSQQPYDGQNPYAIYAPHPQQQAYIARSTRASTMVHPQRAIGPPQSVDMRDNSRGANPSSSRHSPAFVQGSTTHNNEPVYQRVQNYRQPLLEKDGDISKPAPVKDERQTRNRIEKMEQQLANLTAWVHFQKNEEKGIAKPPRSLGSTASDSSDTFPASSTSSLSDIPDGQRPVIGSTGSSASSSSLVPPSTEVSCQIAKLKSDLSVLRRQTQLNMEAMREEFMRASTTIKKVITSVPGADNQISFHSRVEATKKKTLYISEKFQVDQELSDLEYSVEELRNDIINHQCRVQLVDVEAMALLLSNITKNLADLKTQFPNVHETMKEVMNNEMQIVVAEENFLKEEPSKIEKSLMRCKKLTGTLYTLKRLASVQDHRPPHIPTIATLQAAGQIGTTEEDPKKTLLENIRALVPDHDRRVQEMEAREAARERKKKISTQKEALKFGKTLEMATKGLRRASASSDQLDDVKRNSTEQLNVEHQELKEDAPIVSTSQNVLSNPIAPTSQSTSTPSSQSYNPSTSSSSHVTFAPSTSLGQSVSSSSPSVQTLPPSSSSSISHYPANISVPHKPTATVAAMNTTGATSADMLQSVRAAISSQSYNNNIHATEKNNNNMPNSNPSSVPYSNVKSATLPFNAGTDRLANNNIQTINSSSAMTLNTGKSEAPVSTSSSENPSINNNNNNNNNKSTSFKPPTFAKPPRQFISPTKNSSDTKLAPSTESNPLDEEFNRGINKERPKSSMVYSSASKAPVMSKANSVDLSPTKASRPLSVDMVGKINGNISNNGVEESYGKDEDKLPNKPYRRRSARSAFSSAWVSPSSSPPPVSPKTNPLSPGMNSIAQVTTGGTINLVLSGVASPKSPTNPGTFTITPPTEITVDTTSNKPTPPSSSPSSPASSLTSSKSDTDTPNKPKKVPPPPPPRKGSRPTSMTNLTSINGVEQPIEAHQHNPEESAPPQFVGGVLGQHRLSGGPLSSTPKPASQQKALSTFERDLASGIYANMNRPDLQNQTSSPQQMMDRASTKSSSTNSSNSNLAPIAKIDTLQDMPTPLVTTSCVENRNERESSSESNSSSNSGTSSMGSQQSVAAGGVARSVSVNLRNSKPKPEPPKRQSSLLGRGPSKISDTRVPNRRKTMNGVDL